MDFVMCRCMATGWGQTVENGTLEAKIHQVIPAFFLTTLPTLSLQKTDENYVDTLCTSYRSEGNRHGFSHIQKTRDWMVDNREY
jgi:hypothetical protein